MAENSYVVIDDFMPTEMFELIQGYFNQAQKANEFTKAAIGTNATFQIRESIRGDFTLWLQRDEETLTPFWSLIDEIIFVMNRYCYLSLSDSEFHFAYYPKGSFYKRHLDQFSDRNNRMISVIMYLNEDWKSGDGGELRIYQNGEHVDVAPLARRCVLFKSADVEHEVLATATGRASVTGWLLYQPVGLGQLFG